MSTNTIKTFALLAGFGALIMVIGSFFGEVGLLIGFGIALAFVGGSYWFSDKLAVKAAGAHEISEPEAPTALRDGPRARGARWNIPMPKVYLSPAAQPNAFADRPEPRPRRRGRDRGAAAGPRSRRGPGRARPRDEPREEPATSSSDPSQPRWPWASPSSPGWRCGERCSAVGGGDRDNNVFGVLAMAILAPIAAVMIQMGISRSREYEARPRRRRAARRRR